MWTCSVPKSTGITSLLLCSGGMYVSSALCCGWNSRSLFRRKDSFGSGQLEWAHALHAKWIPSCLVPHLSSYTSLPRVSSKFFFQIRKGIWSLLSDIRVARKDLIVVEWYKSCTVVVGLCFFTYAFDREHQQGRSQHLSYQSWHVLLLVWVALLAAERSSAIWCAFIFWETWWTKPNCNCQSSQPILRGCS